MNWMIEKGKPKKIVYINECSHEIYDRTVCSLFHCFSENKAKVSKIEDTNEENYFIKKIFE